MPPRWDEIRWRTSYELKFLLRRLGVLPALPPEVLMQDGRTLHPFYLATVIAAAKWRQDVIRHLDNILEYLGTEGDTSPGEGARAERGFEFPSSVLNRVGAPRSVLARFLTFLGWTDRGV